MQYAFGEFELDPGLRTLRRRGEEVEIQEKALDVLVYMIEHRGGFVSHDELLDALWPGVSVTPAALSQSVHKARIAVGDDGEHQTVLRTEHGQELIVECRADEQLPQPGTVVDVGWAPERAVVLED